MKRILLASFGVFLAIAANAQVLYSEDFDGIGGPTAGGAGTYTFAPGWLLRNVDNGTPATSVAYVNEAWERREDFSFSVTDSAAFSTSWVNPVVTSNDWMWTPLVSGITANTVLRWNAVTYDAMYRDGYEVRIMVAPTAPTGGTGAIGNQITNSTVVFSTTAENTTWTAREVNLSAYAGQQIYVGFRNNSTDKFLLLIDDVQIINIINNDLRVTSGNHGEYTVLTADHATTAANFELEGTINNNGLLSMPNVALGCQVWIDGVLSTTVQSTVDPSLASGANVTKTIAYSPTIEGVYTFKFFPISTTADQFTSNDSINDATPFAISTDFLARDNGVVTGALGIGAGNGGYLGNVFNLETTTQFEGVDMYVNGGYTGEPLAIAVFNTDGLGVPQYASIVTTTDTLLYIDDSARLYHLPFPGGLSLPAGKYGFMTIEFDSTMQVANTAQIFTNNTVYAGWPTNPNGANSFSAVESFGAAFSKPFVIRPVIDVCFGEIGGTLDSTGFAGCGQSDGYAELTLDPGYTVTWEDLSTNPINAALPVGYNTYTITNANNCTFIDSVLTINASAPLVAIIDSTLAPCDGTGSVTLDVSGGTSPYVITWSNGDTGLVLDDVAGTYTATIVDAANCSAVLPATIVNTASPSASVLNIDNAPCNGDDGTVFLDISGGTTPYSVLWSNGETTVNMSDPAGTYSVTVTDDNGCTSTINNIVITEPAVLAPNASGTDESCASCNDGTAEVVVTGGTAPYTYLWSNGSTTDSIGGLAPGTYTVDITDANGCTATGTYTVAQFDDTGIDELASLGILVYPNPIVDFLSVEGKNQTIEKLTVYDTQGKLIATGTNVIDFRKIASGSYQLVIKTDKKQFITTVVK